uniref:Nucleoprotein n=1 Tax=Chaerephon bat coronavirus TaxID=2991261 RepID=A0AB38ZDV8_9NIDO
MSNRGAAKVGFNTGRVGRIPYSLFNPVRTTNGEPLWKVLPNNAVPLGNGGKDQQIGYWNQQTRWRMQKGQRKDLPPNWHFYYLGTGPHADVPYRQRTEGVFWVAKEGAKTEPTNLPTRRANQQPQIPKFSGGLPNNLEIVEKDSQSRPNSRSVSRSNSRGPSRSQTPSRNYSRSNSRDDQSSNSQQDLVAAVTAALKSMGISPRNQSGSGSSTPSAPRKKKNVSGTSTPVNSPKNPMDFPEWRRTPTPENPVDKLFGPRGGWKNFGSDEFVKLGVQAPGYAQAASLVPHPAALVFGGNVSVRELKDTYEIQYTYKATVPKSDKNLEVFLQQVDAYKNGSPKPKRERKRQNSGPTPTDNQVAAAVTAFEQNSNAVDNPSTSVAISWGDSVPSIEWENSADVEFVTEVTN